MAELDHCKRIRELEDENAALQDIIKQEQQVTLLLEKQLKEQYEEDVDNALKERWRHYVATQPYPFPSEIIHQISTGLIESLPNDDRFMVAFHEIMNKFINQARLSYHVNNTNPNDKVHRVSIYLPELRLELLTRPFI